MPKPSIYHSHTFYLSFTLPSIYHYIIPIHSIYHCIISTPIYHCTIPILSINHLFILSFPYLLFIIPIPSIMPKPSIYHSLYLLFIIISFPYILFIIVSFPHLFIIVPFPYSLLIIYLSFCLLFSSSI